MHGLLSGFLYSCLLTLSFSQAAFPQTSDTAAAPLREIRADGIKILSQPQVISLSGLATGTQVSKKDLQAAADALLATGLFSKVGFNFQSRPDGVYLTFHLVEAPRLPVYFDNIPWFGDAELTDAIRVTLPFFDGTLPEAGAVVEQAAEAVKALLAAHSLNISLEHATQPNPLADGNVQAFRIVGAALQISQIEFGDPQLAQSKIVQQHLSSIRNKPYSRTTIDLFLFEQIRPLYLQQGYLRVKLGPPEVRLTGNPNQKLPSQIPVFIPITKGPVYRWKGVEWKGNGVISSIALTSLIGLKPGDVADGSAIERGWQRVSQEYGQRGYLEVKVDPAPSYDHAEHSVSYTVTIQEGGAFRFHSLLITGMSLAGERLIQQAWTVKPGDVFDEKSFEQFLTNLESHKDLIFKELPVHYTEVGHWLETDQGNGTVDVLLDFK